MWKTKKAEPLGDTWAPSDTLFLPTARRPQRKQKLRTCVLGNPWVKWWVAAFTVHFKGLTFLKYICSFRADWEYVYRRAREREGEREQGCVCVCVYVYVCVHTPNTMGRRHNLSTFWGANFQCCHEEDTFLSSHTYTYIPVSEKCSAQKESGYECGCGLYTHTFA